MLCEKTDADEVGAKIGADPLTPSDTHTTWGRITSLFGGARLFTSVLHGRFPVTGSSRVPRNAFVLMVLKQVLPPRKAQKQRYRSAKVT